MRKVFAALALTVAASGALSGCDVHVGPYAAVVNGTTISQSELNASLSAAASNTDYICSVTGGQKIPTTGVGTGTYDIHFVDFVLSTLVRAKLAADQAADQHLAVTSFLTSIAQQQLAGTLGSTVQGCSGTSTSILAKLSTDYRTALLSLYEDLDVLAGARQDITLTNDGITQYVNAHPEIALLPCVNYIQAPSLAVANEAIAAVKHGTPFTTEATKVTQASSTSIPCGPLAQSFPAQIITALEKLSVGGVTPPIDYNNTIYVFELAPPESATAQQVLQTVIGTVQNEFSTVLATLQATGTVQLDPAYGAWPKVATSAGPITPPAAPATKFLPAPNAIAVPTTTTTVPPAAGAG